MIPPFLQMILAALALSAATGLAGYFYGHSGGVDEGRAEIQARWDEQSAAQSKAIVDALLAKQESDAKLSRQLQEQSNEHTETNRRRDLADAGARRELQRVRDALATARIGARERGDAPAPRPQADGAPSAAGELLGACAERLVELGGQAGKLAAQVIGLQAYARLAQQACGAVP